MNRQKLRWLIFVLILAALNCAEDSDTEAKKTDRSAPSRRLPFVFTDVTEVAGLSGFSYENGARGQKCFPEAMGYGGGFIDYDGDGWQDILLVGGGVWESRNHGKPPALGLYRNEGDGTFVLHTDEAGLGELTAYGFGVTVADYDNDGDEDFFFSTLFEDMLFRNDGGKFVEVGHLAGVSGGINWSTSAVFFDADKDGWPDLYVGRYVVWTPETDLWCSLDGETKSYCTPEIYEGIPSRFYRNNGDGTFSDVSEEAGFLPAPGKTLGAVEFDYNHDGWSDLVVANDTQRDLLYENNGDGTFTEKGVMSGMAYDENGRALAGMGIDTGVVDRTGEETIFVGNFSKQTISAFRHSSNGLFFNRSAISGISRQSLMTLTFGLFLFDVDLDGDLDLFAANGHVQEEIEQGQAGVTYREPSHLFLNDGDGNFEDVSPLLGGPLQMPVLGRGSAYADYDRDGDVDILVMDNSGPVYLWRNDMQRETHYLRIRIRGKDKNRDGFGTRVVAVVGNKTMVRRVRSGASFLSNSERTLTFGLSDAMQVDSLQIYWPDGQVDKFHNVQADRELEIVYGQEPLTLPRP